MLNLKSILYPTDFSECSLAALPYAVGLAQQSKAALHCMHVVDLPHEQHLTGKYMVPMEVPHVPRDKLLRTARVRFDRFMRESFLGIDEVTSRLVSGKPSAEIIQYAKDHEIDLIVLGTNGSSEAKSKPLGSVARNVVNSAPCPVLTVRYSE